MDPVVVHTIKLMQHAKKLRGMISSIQQQQDGMVGIFGIKNWILIFKMYFTKYVEILFRIKT